MYFIFHFIDLTETLQVKSGVCEWLAWMLRMKRPGKEFPRKKSTKMKDVEMRERSSRSLLANVLDLDDDFRGAVPPMGNHTNHNYSGVKIHNETRLGNMNTMTSGYGGCENVFLRDILKELRYMTEKMRKDNDFQEQCNDWKFAAMVIDRLCLWVFTIFTIVSTFAILFSAPHVIA